MHEEITNRLTFQQALAFRLSGRTLIPYMQHVKFYVVDFRKNIQPLGSKQAHGLHLSYRRGRALMPVTQQVKFKTGTEFRENIACFPRLERLNLFGCEGITEKDITQVVRLKNLRTLHLEGLYNIGNAGLAHLKDLPFTSLHSSCCSTRVASYEPEPRKHDGQPQEQVVAKPGNGRIGYVQR